VVLFLSLAIVQRSSELVISRAGSGAETKGSDYRGEDMNVLLALGAASGYDSVFVVTSYLPSREVVAVYIHPRRLWLLCQQLAYWIGRTLLLANPGNLHDNALTDRVSWSIGGCFAGNRCRGDLIGKADRRESGDW
jgi:hypothetical protein